MSNVGPFDRSSLTNRTPPPAGGPGKVNGNNVFPKIPPDYVSTYKVVDFRERTHATKRIDDCTDMKGWTAEALRQYIYAMREIVVNGYGTGKNLIGEWGMIKHEKLYKSFENCTEDEIVAKKGAAFTKLGNLSFNQLLALASRYRFLDYKRIVSNHESLDGWCPAEYGFNPYRLSPKTAAQIKNTQYGYHFLRCNEATGIFDCPELEQAERDGKSAEELITLNELRMEIASLKQRDNDKARKIIELNVKNQRLSNQLESVNQIFMPNRSDSSSAPPTEPQQSLRATLGTEAPDNAPQPRVDTSDDDIMVVEQPPNVNRDRIVEQPTVVTGTNEYIPSMNFSKTAATVYSSYKNRNPQLNEWCNYCKGYVGHHGGRGPGGCAIKRLKKPTTCWWCGRPGHQKATCKNERVPGAAWNPGHEPIPGQPRPGFNGNRQSFATYIPDRDNKSNRIFARTPGGKQSDNDIVDEKAPDCVKIMARGFQEAFATAEKPLGHPALNEAYYRAKQVEEQDLLRRENDNFFYIMRRVRSWLVDKEKAMNSFIIRDIDKEAADELKVKLDDGKIDLEGTKLEIVKYIKKLVGIDLPSTDEIADFRFAQFQTAEKDTEGTETQLPKYNLRVELIDRAWVKRILIKSAKITNEESGPLPTEYFTLEEVRNDAYVLKNVEARNDALRNGSDPELKRGQWIRTGKKGVYRIIFKRADEEHPAVTDANAGTADMPPLEPDTSQALPNENLEGLAGAAAAVTAAAATTTPAANFASGSPNNANTEQPQGAETSTSTKRPFSSTGLTPTNNASKRSNDQNDSENVDKENGIVMGDSGNLHSSINHE